MEFLFYILVFVIGFLIGEAFVLYKLRHSLRLLAESQGIDVDSELEKMDQEESVTLQIHRLQVEQINNILYLFDRTSDEFICQANDIDELAKLSKTYKNITAATVIHDNKVFLFKDGTAHEYPA
jgi:hypothetical protein